MITEYSSYLHQSNHYLVAEVADYKVLKQILLKNKPLLILLQEKV